MLFSIFQKIGLPLANKGFDFFILYLFSEIKQISDIEEIDLNSLPIKRTKFSERNFENL